MLFEASSIASVIPVMVETLRSSYALDAQPTLTAVGLQDYESLPSGARVPDAVMIRLWKDLELLTGDALVGVAVGQQVRPTTFHALGFAWLASETLADALARLCRYDELVGTGAELELVRGEDSYDLFLREPESEPSLPVAVDAYFAAVLQMCKRVTNRSFAPQSVHFRHGDHGRAGDYATAFEAPVYFGQPTAKLVFEAAGLERLLPSRDAELARSNDQVVEAYLESLKTKELAQRLRDKQLNSDEIRFILGARSNG